MSNASESPSSCLSHEDELRTDLSTPGDGESDAADRVSYWVEKHDSKNVHHRGLVNYVVRQSRLLPVPRLGLRLTDAIAFSENQLPLYSPQSQSL